MLHIPKTAYQQLFQVLKTFSSFVENIITFDIIDHYNQQKNLMRKLLLLDERYVVVKERTSEQFIKRHADECNKQLDWNYCIVCQRYGGHLTDRGKSRDTLGGNPTRNMGFRCK